MLTSMISSEQMTDFIRSAIVTLSANLQFIYQVSNEPRNRQGLVVGVSVVQALCSHVAAEKTSISCQTCNWHSHVSVNGEDVLVSRQF